jgi:hypothetical protein
MFFLVYVSSATRPFSGEDLRVLLETCRKNNAELGVTGMLLYKDGNFMQVLEGDEGSVRGLYERIAADPRHGGEITLQQGFAEGRQFPDWSMGFPRPGLARGARRPWLQRVPERAPHRPRVLRRPLPSSEAPDHVQEDHVSKRVRAPSFANGSAEAGPDLGRQNVPEACTQTGRGGSGKNCIRRRGGTSNADQTKIMQDAVSGFPGTPLLRE